MYRTFYQETQTLGMMEVGVHCTCRSGLARLFENEEDGTHADLGRSSTSPVVEDCASLGLKTKCDTSSEFESTSAIPRLPVGSLQNSIDFFQIFVAGQR